MIIYPAIDIRGGQAVRLLQGDYARETIYDADPADAGRRWAAEGAEVLHVVDLDGAKAGEPRNLEAVRRIAAAVECPIQVGGGLRDAESVAAVLDAGAARVVIGTAAGTRVLTRLPQQAFRRVLGVLLLTLGAYMCVAGGK